MERCKNTCIWFRCKNNIAITITDETIPDVVPTPLQEIEKIELLDDKNMVNMKGSRF